MTIISKLIAAGATLVGIVALVLFGNIAVWLWQLWTILGERFPYVADTITIFIPLLGIVLASLASWLLLLGLYNRWARLSTVEADKDIGRIVAHCPFPDGVHSVSLHDSRR